DEELLKLELGSLKDEQFDLEITGFDMEEIDQFLANEFSGDGEGGSIEEETIPEAPDTPVTQPGDLWILGDHRLLCGDSTSAEDVIRLMDGKRADLFATDPPYLVNYNGKNHPGNNTTRDRKSLNKDWSESYGITWDDSSQGPELYEGFIRAAIDHAIDSHAAWYCWHASKRQAMLEQVWEKMGAFQHQQIIWNKEKGVLTRSKYLWKHEPCFMGWIKGNMPAKIDGAEFLSTVWDIPGLAGEERPDHPTPKPLECFAIPMRQHVKPGGLCYEPFSGSGSQIMAGESTGRRVYAMEVSPVYVDVAVKRFIQATDRIVYLDGGGGKTFDDVAADRGVELAA
ncbi:MAG: site-specific DNA-methyltransferase, partial [Magnetococcales bacterium]|nr:site-specific DNA-methyltransferase [Magnetococcales bacterium]